MEDPRFRFFFDLTRIINFFQQHQQSPMVYLLENTYPGEDINLNPHVKKAQDLVEAFLGPSVRLDSADMGAAPHGVRLYWTNMLPTEALRHIMPQNQEPEPSLQECLLPYHETSIPTYSHGFPFAQHNRRGQPRVCMPTVVSFPRSNAYRPKPDERPGEGEVYNVIYERWEEPSVGEKERLIGYNEGDTAAEGVTEVQRTVRLGRALNSHTMRWFRAFLWAAQK